MRGVAVLLYLGSQLKYEDKMARKVRIYVRTPDASSPVSIRDYDTEETDPNQSTAAYWVGGYGMVSLARITGTVDIGDAPSRCSFVALDGSVIGEFTMADLELFIDGSDVTGDYSSFEEVFSDIGKYLFVQNTGVLIVNAIDNLAILMNSLNGALQSSASDTLRVTVIP